MLSRPRLRLVVAAIALGLLIFAGQASFRSSGPLTYVVQPGDTLWRISQDYHVSVYQLAAANGMQLSDVLLVGRRLTIPGPGSSGGGSTGSGAPVDGQVVVDPGQTLWSIAQEHGVSVYKLAAANGMSLSDVLLVGRHLSLPGFAPAPGPAPAAPARTAGSPARPSGPPAVDPNFCATFTPEAGPQGVLPALLAASPSRLALRPLFVRWAGDYGISPALLEAIAWQESGWQQGVVSSAGAVGIGQILPGTAHFLSTEVIGEKLNINSVSDNLRMSAAYLGWLERHFGGNLCETIAGYYEGAQNMDTFGVFVVSEPYVASVESLMPGFE